MFWVTAHRTVEHCTLLLVDVRAGEFQFWDPSDGEFEYRDRQGQQRTANRWTIMRDLRVTGV